MPRKKRVWRQEEIDQIKAEYLAGSSLREIGVRRHTGQYVICSILEAEGVPRRSTRYQAEPFRTPLATWLAHNGKTQYDLADALGCTVNTAQRYCADKRPPGKEAQEKIKAFTNGQITY